MINVLFVCLGNICRSPMAEAVFSAQVRRAGLAGQIQADLAGTGSWYVGEAAHDGTLEVLEDHGIIYNGRARQVDRHDFERFDYVLAMDRTNLNEITRIRNRGEFSAAQKAERFSPQARGPEIALFLSYAHKLGTVSVLEVPDPYYDDRFDSAYQLINRGCEALLDHIRKVQHL